MITLIPADDGSFSESGQDVIWTLTTYTEPRENLDDCTNCGEPIEEWDLYLCLDGGETAHTGCVTLTTTEREG